MARVLFDLGLRPVCKSANDYLSHIDLMQLESWAQEAYIESHITYECKTNKGAADLLEGELNISLSELDAIILR